MFALEFAWKTQVFGGLYDRHRRAAQQAIGWGRARLGFLFEELDTAVLQEPQAASLMLARVEFAHFGGVERPRGCRRHVT